MSADLRRVRVAAAVAVVLAQVQETCGAGLGPERATCVEVPAMVLVTCAEVLMARCAADHYAARAAGLGVENDAAAVLRAATVAAASLCSAVAEEGGALAAAAPYGEESEVMSQGIP